MAFDSVILYDKPFSNLLSKIKQAYDDWIKNRVGIIDENKELKY